MSTITHEIRGTSTELLGRLNQKRAIRYWFDAFGSLTGVWLGRNGKTYAVGSGRRPGYSYVYRAMPLEWTAYDKRKSALEDWSGQS